MQQDGSHTREWSLSLYEIPRGESRRERRGKRRGRGKEREGGRERERMRLEALCKATHSTSQPGFHSNEDGRQHLPASLS